MIKTTQQIPTGYKQTEVGVIPEDWHIKKLGEVSALSQGVQVDLSEQTKEYKSGYDVFLRIENYTQGSDDFRYIPKKYGENKRISKDDVVVVRYGTTAGYIGIGFEGILANNLFKIDPNKMLLSKGYLYRYLKSDKAFNYLQNAMFGGAMPALSFRVVKNMLITLPNTVQEQNYIAKVFSDTDELTEKLEKLIAKKKAIKQGLMQELLTGKRRLPGFSGEWEKKKLGDVCSRVTTGKLDANAMSATGRYRFYTCAREFYYIDNYAFDTEALLVSGNGANVGYIHYYKGKFNAYQRTYILSEFSENIFLIKLLLDKNLQERIRVEVNAGNTPYITMGTLTDMALFIPPTIKEQSAIANILSDMDIEIDYFEKELVKYQRIKIGMMQQLLTGKIRLVN